MRYYSGFTPTKNDDGTPIVEQEQVVQPAEELISLKSHKRKVRRTAIASFLIACVLLTGFGLGFKVGDKFGSNGKSVVTQELQTNGVPTASIIGSNGENPITTLVKRYGPAVVSIETESQVKSSFNNDFFWFFGQPFPETSRKVQGLGSGFIISNDGYVLTNNHVIDGASLIKVKLEGNDEPLTAKVIGRDAELDLAVLKIDAGYDLPVVPLGDSDRLETGEWVVAIGNPYGLDHTVTVGVISAKGRPLVIEGNSFKDLLQTDASINPGNSGGPLLNLNGEVIGINTAVSTQGQGLGFAVPINTVKKVLEELINQGKVSRPWLGVYVSDLTEELAAYLQMNKDEGAQIVQIIEKSPAEKAGLRRGDIILSFNKQKITGANDVTKLVSEAKVGDKVELEILRNHTKQTITVTLGER
ncbi:MAG: trypsin-like peptidase domain-containing protein [Peptococcia bacterium]